MVLQLAFEVGGDICNKKLLGCILDKNVDWESNEFILKIVIYRFTYANCSTRTHTTLKPILQMRFVAQKSSVLVWKFAGNKVRLCRVWITGYCTPGLYFEHFKAAHNQQNKQICTFA